MIKVITSSGTEYIIDKENKQIKRIPQPGTTYENILRGFVNVGEFQPYDSFEGLELHGNLHVIYPNVQQWSYSTTIKEIDYGYEEPNLENFKICDDPDCNEEMEELIQQYKKDNNE